MPQEPFSILPATLPVTRTILPGETTEQHARRLVAQPFDALRADQYQEVIVLIGLMNARTHYWTRRADTLQAEADALILHAQRSQSLAGALQDVARHLASREGSGS